MRSVGIIGSSHLSPTFTSQPLDSSQQWYWLKYILTNLRHASFTNHLLMPHHSTQFLEEQFLISQSFSVINPILQHSFKMRTLYLLLIPYTYHGGKGFSAKWFIAPNLDIHSTDIYNWDSQAPFTDNWGNRHSFSLF